MKFIKRKMLFSLFLCCLLVPNHSYAFLGFFSDDIKEFSLADLLLGNMITTMDYAEDIEKKKAVISEFTEAYEKREGIDISKSLYDVLKDNPEITNLSENEESGYGVKKYIISFRLKNENISLEFLGTDNAYVKFVPVDDYSRTLAKFAFIYGIDRSHVKYIHDLFRVRF